MRTSVELVARRREAGGRTALVLNRCEGILAARSTGVAEAGPAAGGAQVHLVGTGAGPLGGDEVSVRVVVEAGARLALRGVAATLSMPDSAGRSARVVLDLRVEAGGVLDCALEPLVAVRGSDLHARTAVDVADEGVLDLVEAVVLGRGREVPGRWRGTLRADLGGRPWLRQSVGLGAGAPAWDALAAPRVLVSRLRSPAAVGLVAAGARAAAPAGTTAGGAVVMPLAGGGELWQGLGGDLAQLRRDLAVLELELEALRGERTTSSQRPPRSPSPPSTHPSPQARPRSSTGLFR